MIRGRKTAHQDLYDAVRLMRFGDCLPWIVPDGVTKNAIRCSAHQYAQKFGLVVRIVNHGDRFYIIRVE